MEKTVFRKNISSLVTKISTFRTRRVESAYEDLISLAIIAKEIEGNIAGQDIFDLNKVSDNQQVFSTIQKQGQIVALLKALYLFSNIFISILLGELINIKKISLIRFLQSKNQMLTSLSMDKILPAYCIVVYRNKVIAHHDIRRMSSYTIGHGNVQFRFAPLPEDFHISNNSITELARLKSSYVSTVQDLRNVDNQFEQLKILFYNIPIGELGDINPDRNKIDHIAEEGGCTSMTRDEIIQAIDTFTKAIVEAV